MKVVATIEGIRADARHAVRNSYTGQRTAILKGVAFYSRHRFCIKIDVRNFKICSVKSSNSNNGIAFAILVQFKSKSSLKISAGVAYSGFIKIMPCGYFNIGCIITTRTCVVCLPPDFRTCRCFCLMMYYSMPKRFTIFITTSFTNRLFGAGCRAAMATFRFGMFAVERANPCMRICAFIFYPFSEVVRSWIYCNRQFVKRCFRFVFVVLKNFVANRTFVMRFHALFRASRFCFWNYIAVFMTERIAIFFPANRARRLFGAGCRATCVAECRYIFRLNHRMAHRTFSML